MKSELYSSVKRGSDLLPKSQKAVIKEHLSTAEGSYLRLNKRKKDVCVQMITSKQDSSSCLCV